MPAVLAAVSVACAGSREPASHPQANIEVATKTASRKVEKKAREALPTNDPETRTSEPKKASCERYERARVQKGFTGEVSYYADSLAGNKTASGTPYDPSAFTAAHRKLRFGTILRVTDENSGNRTCVVVNDRGPFGKASRVLDLSRAAAEELGIVRRGIASVKVEILTE